MSQSSTVGFLANLFLGLILTGGDSFLAWHHSLGGVTGSALILMLFVLEAHRFPLRPVAAICIWVWQARMFCRRGKEAVLGEGAHHDLASQGN